MNDPEPSPPFLSYAGPLAQRGIVVETWPGGLLITLPTHKWFWVGIGVRVTGLLVVCCATAFVFGLANIDDPTWLIVTAAVLMSAGVIALIAALRGPRNPTIELNCGLLRVMGVYKPGCLDAEWAAAAIVSLQYAQHANAIIVRARNCDLYELRPVSDSVTLRSLTAILNEALKEYSRKLGQQ